MIVSMTGYGKATSQKDDTIVTVEIRSVNHRFLDLHVRLAREFAFLESDVQQIVRNQVARGRVDVSVSVQTGTPIEVMVNATAVRSYVEAAAKLREQFQFQDSLDLRTLLALPGVLQSKEAVTIEGLAGGGVPELVKQAVREALEGVVTMRKLEGEALRNDMLRHLENIRGRAGCIETLAPATVNECRKKLEERLSQQLPPTGLDPQRLAQEVAILADRCDISEEIARLKSHIDQYASLLETGAEVGKKLDFLLQEMQREANTILSKAANLEITRQGISAKAAIEKLREQAQNVE